jgi:hypothetical protein
MPKNLNDIDDNFIKEDDFDYSYDTESDDDFEYSNFNESEEDSYEYEEDSYEYEEELEDYSNIETIEEQYEREDNEEYDENMEYALIEEENQSILKAIFLSLFGKQSEYTSLDKKLNTVGSKLIFMIFFLVLLVLMFIGIIIFKR